MGNPLVDAAIKGLSLVGIDVPPSAEGFIDLLINAGEDALTAVPHIISVTEQLGAETWSTLEQLVQGMEQYGPTGYIQRQIAQAFRPHVDTINYTYQQKQIMLDNHRITLTNFQSQTQTLFTGPRAFSGPAATQSQMHLNFLLSGTTAHLDLLEQSLAIDQKFFTDYQSATEAAANAEIIILIIVGIILIIALVSVALTGGASLALIGGMAVGISVVEAWLLAGILGCFVAWGIAHELLAHPVSLDWNPPKITITSTAHVLISAGPTLPNPPLTPDEQALANDLSSEFGGQIPQKVLEYLVKVLGASKLTAAMIRCLYQNGYLDVSDIKVPALTSNSNSAWQSISENLNPNDLEGAWKENNPGGVDPSTITNPDNISNGNHDEEVSNALDSIDSFIKSLNSKINDLTIRITRNPTSPDIATWLAQKPRLQDLLSAYTKLRKFIQAKVAKGSPSPDTWPDQGKLPIVEDLLQVSTCKVPNAKYFN